MTQTDVGDHTGIRPRDLGQSVHLSEITDPHFQHCHLMFIPQVEHRKRQAQLIIEIPLGLQHLIFLRKYRGDHFLGAGLSHAACDPHNRNLQLLQIILRNILYRLKRRFHLDIGIRLFSQIFLGKSGQSPFLHNSFYKIMAVRPCPLYRHEKTSFPDFSAVRIDSRDFPGLICFRAFINSFTCLGNML